MSTLGLYLPRTSWVHRMPAGVKLLLLFVAGAGSIPLDRPWQVAAGLVVVLLGQVAARLPAGWAVTQARPLLVVLVVVGAFHVVVSGWGRALVVVGVILVLVLLAGLVTATTRVSDLVEVVVRLVGPLRRVGVDPERLGLLLALSIRSVPVVVGIAAEVRDAQRARGLTSSPRAYAVPLVIRSLRHADTLGEALVARGADD